MHAGDLGACNMEMYESAPAMDGRNVGMYVCPPMRRGPLLLSLLLLLLLLFLLLFLKQIQQGIARIAKLQ